MLSKGWIIPAAALVLLVAACAPPAAAPPAAAPTLALPSTPTPQPFYAGKTIRFVVGYTAGGGYDTYARLFAKYIGKYIPGNPTAIVENMPGGGSLVAANYVYKVAKPDGLTIGSFGEGLVLQQAMGAEGVEFDANKFYWLGAADQASQACAVRADRLKTITDTIGAPKPVILGATAPGANTWDFPKTLNFALGTNLKLVGGYGGTAEMRLATEGGETDGGCWTWESIKVTWKAALDSGFVKVVIYQAPRPVPELAGVPRAIDLAKTEEAKQAILLMTSPTAITKPYVVTPGTPEDRVAILRKAFADMMKDPELLAEAKKVDLEVNPLSAEDTVKIVKDMLAAPPELAKKLKEALK